MSKRIAGKQMDQNLVNYWPLFISWPPFRGLYRKLEVPLRKGKVDAL